MFEIKINLILNNSWGKEEIVMQIMKYLYLNDSESITYQIF